MEIKELRIGNWIMRTDIFPITYDEWEMCDVASVYNGMMGMECYEPIPLTVELLLNNKFRGNANEYIDSIFDGKNLYAPSINGWSIRIAFENGKFYFHLDNFTSIELKYVHQLQNLFFVLTGTELEFNF